MYDNKTFYHKELSYAILGIAFKIHSKIGCGLPEHNYQKALMIEFTSSSIPFTTQERHLVMYKDDIVGHFITDFIIDKKIILELKSDERISSNHIAQLFTYMRTTRVKIGYLLNFGARSLQYKRLIL